MTNPVNYESIKKAIEVKKKLIEKEGAKTSLLRCLIPGSSLADPEMVEWAMAFADYFDEHPEEWEAAQSLGSNPRSKHLRRS